MHEWPIVCSADDAISIYQTGDLDALISGLFLCQNIKDQA